MSKLGEPTKSCAFERNGKHFAENRVFGDIQTDLRKVDMHMLVAIIYAIILVNG